MYGSGLGGFGVGESQGYKGFRVTFRFGDFGVGRLAPLAFSETVTF